MKFKIWHPETKRMYGPYTMWEIGTMQTSDEVWISQYVAEDAYPKDLIYLRNTGFKDWGGKEIYEGDILKLEEGPWPPHYDDKQLGNVFFCEEHGAWMIRYYELCGEANEGEFLYCEADAYNIIGNVYEDPICFIDPEEKDGEEEV